MSVTLPLCLLVTSLSGLVHSTFTPHQEPSGSGKGGSLPVASSAERGNRSAGFLPSIYDADEAIASPRQDMTRGPKPADFEHQWQRCNERPASTNRYTGDSCPAARPCSHGCRFCYVPSTSTNKLKPHLANHGVSDPDQEWGQYALLRPWDEKKFILSLNKAENTPSINLKPDGNRVVLLCSTTDPYQVLPHFDPKTRRQLMQDATAMVRRALELILNESTLNVRILTRSPPAKRDFDLFRQFGDRLLFGMSLPTLDNRLAKIYEPGAPSPSQHLKTLQEAKAAGVPVFVAVAPTYPECDESDLETTLGVVKALDPVAVFHEPINIRAENMKRIAQHAATLRVSLRTEVFATPRAWRSYALSALHSVERIARDLGIGDRLHLWPDSSLGTNAALREVEDPAAHSAWLERCWSRVSEWPGKP